MWVNFWPPLLMEGVGGLFGDFLQRLETVGDEAGVQHGDLLDAVLRKLLDRLVGIGLQPLFRPEAGLEGHHELVLPAAPAVRAAAGRSSGTASNRDRPALK